MVETGDWAIPDLIDYLVSIQHTLQPTEVEKLRGNPAFPEEATTERNEKEGGALRKVLKVKASDLYEPLDVFRRIGLPIIDWRGKGGKREWESNSKQGTSDTI